MAVRAAGDFAFGPNDLPRNQIPELRRSRAVYYRMSLFAKMASLRKWFVVCFVAIVLWEMFALFSPCLATAGSAGQCNEGSGSSLLGRGMRLVFGPTHGSSSDGGVRQSLAALLQLWTVVALNASLTVLPLALGACSVFTFCACSAADFSGEIPSQRAERWVWPAGQVGEGRKSVV